MRTSTIPERPAPVAGDVFGGRYRIEREVGRGGMGSVFLAVDLEGGGRVAIKTLTVLQAQAARRFAREADTLRQLAHPGIVRYVAHGEDAAGPWIAMQWIEGRTLGQRLGDGPLTIAETFALAQRVAAALAVAHAADVVHRDIKPENILLPSARFDDAVLVDFGIARGAIEASTLTRPGDLIGTPPYMAPEQARGARDLGPRADMFSLGCVLWECIGGRTLFDADKPIAVLLRILVETAPRLREVVEGVPPALDELIAEMLAKDPADRPADGIALVERLAGMESAIGDRQKRTHPSKELAGLTTDELRLFSLLLARVPSDTAGATVTTVRVPTPVELGDVLRDLVLRGAALGAAVHRLADGSIVGFVTEPLPPPELATRAVRLACLARTALPGWSVAVTTGRGDPAGDVPVGEVVDRAVSLWSPGDAVSIDDLTAQLVEDAFAIVRTPEGILVGDPVPATDDRRRDRALRAPFVGRTHELETLRGAVERVTADRRARVATVLGAPGTGKTRLRRELVRALPQEIVVLVGQGDPMRRDAPLTMLADLVRRGLGLPEAAAPLSLRLVLREKLQRILDPEEFEAVTALVAELVGAPVPDAEATPALRAARRDPALLAEQLRDAFVAWLRRTCRAATVVLVLEDVQWADASTQRFVAAAARTLAGSPLFVLGLARPEWHDEAGLTSLPHERIDLAPLDPTAAHELARALLGDDAKASAVARIARESEGHPLLVEELARSLGDETPRAARTTALGIVEHRLAARPSEERRVLRAAAVLGTVFWRGAVTNLLGWSTEQTPALDEILSRLCDADIVERRRGARFPDEREYRFRHDLFREAAYETLTPDDRRRGHRHAGRWLEAHREPDAAVLAEHYARGGHAARAAHAHLDAARRALHVGDMDAAATHATRGREVAESGERHAELAAVLAEALMWQGKIDQARRVGWEALDALEMGSATWHGAAAVLAQAISRRGNADEGRKLAKRLLALGPIDTVDEALSAAQIAERLGRLGLDREADLLLARGSTEQIRALAHVDPVVQPMWRFAVASRQSHRGETDQAIAGFRWAADRFAELGTTGHQLSALVQLVGVLVGIGLHDEARATVEQADALARQRGARPLGAYLALTGGYILLAEGRTAEAAAVFEALQPQVAEVEDPLLLALTHSFHAMASTQLGDADAALIEAEEAAALLADRPTLDLDVQGILALLLVPRDPLRAMELARAAVEFADHRNRFLGGDMRPRLSLAEALHAAGRIEEAHATIAVARDRVLSHAARVADPRVRRSLCENVPVNARVLTLAREWLG